MSRGAWFHCFAGIAGDMALGSLLDAGADLAEVTALLRRLPVTGWSMEPQAVLRGGIAATALTVLGEDDTVVRTHANIISIIEEARLPERVSRRALATFAALAEAEARLHQRSPATVHFHEVGGIDAIVDIVGTCAALEVLGVDELHASAVATGTGTVRTAHGILPNPAPAVVALLHDAPTYGRAVNLELTTPTGAALLAALVAGWGPLPAMRIEATGYGAGTRDLEELPNMAQVVIGQLGPVADDPPRGQPVVLLEANLDDATGETLAHAIARLLEAGAHDAWITPIIMKKGRPAYTVSALADPALAAQIATTLTTETGSLGVRGQMLERWPVRRSLDSVDVEGMPVRVKVSPGRMKAEHDDVAHVARVTGLPLGEVRWQAESAWRGRASEPPSDEPA